MRATPNEAIELLAELNRSGSTRSQMVRALNKSGIKPAMAKRWNGNMVQLTLSRHVLGKANSTTTGGNFSAPAPQTSTAELREAVKIFLDLPFSDTKKWNLCAPYSERKCEIF